MDRKIFEEGSAVRARMIEYGALFTELHVVVFSLKAQGFARQQIGENVFVYPTNSSSKMSYFFDVSKIIQQQNLSFDVVTAQGVEGGVAGWLVGRKYKCPMQLQIHDDLYSPYYKQALPLNRLRYMLAQFLLKRAVCVRVVSPRTKECIEQRYARLRGNVSLLPIFVDTERIQHQMPQFDLHERYPQFEKIVLVVSRLTQEKNVACALEVFARVVKKYPNTGLVIAGDGALRVVLEARAKQLGIGANVIFLGWMDDMISCYKTADVYLHVSKYEGFGMALVEAAICGIPIVTSEVGIATMWKHVAGVSVCSVNDSECFKKKLVDFLGHINTPAQEALQYMATSGALFTKESYLERYRQSIEQCMNKKKY